MFDCVCSCGNIRLQVPRKPTEIAQCYCSICQFLHKNQFASFVQYNQSEILFDTSKLLTFASSNRALRYRCPLCRQWICMIYNNSESIWLCTDFFSIDLTGIQKYDIYRANT